MSVKIRHYDQDTPFGAWLRAKGQSGELPSNSIEVGVTASDVDMVVRCWKNNASGKQIQCIVWLEVKTRNGDCDYAQDSLFSAMSVFAREVQLDDFNVRFYGIFRLRMSGTSPINSQVMLWERWPWKRHGVSKPYHKADLIKSVISESVLVRILKSELHPCTLLEWKPHKSHHGSNTIYEPVTTELGFTVDKPIRKIY